MSSLFPDTIFCYFACVYAAHSFVPLVVVAPLKLALHLGCALCGFRLQLSFYKESRFDIQDTSEIKIRQYIAIDLPSAWRGRSYDFGVWKGLYSHSINAGPRFEDKENLTDG